MRAAVVVLCLVGAAGLWGWAMFWPKQPLPIPERLCGEFDLFRYEPGSATEQPYPPGLERRFRFDPAGHFRIRILSKAPYELRRQEGTLRIDAEGILTMMQVSMDRQEAPDGPWRYRVAWDRDKDGEFVRLTEIDRGYSLFLRRTR